MTLPTKPHAIEHATDAHWKATLDPTYDARHDAADTIEVMCEALQNIARQNLWEEIDGDEIDGCDFEGAYDTIIKIARAAIAKANAT
jgi:hypothetical protein